MHSEVCSQSVDTVISPAAVKAETASAWILIKQHHLTGFKLLSKAYFKCRCFAGQRVIIPIIQMTQRRVFHISWPFCFVAVPNASVHFSSSATQRAWFCFPSPCSCFFLYRRGLRSLFCKLIYSNHGLWRLIRLSAQSKACLSQQRHVHIIHINHKHPHWSLV